MSTALNTNRPVIRCGMCGGRCRNNGRRWIDCRNGCAWSSHDTRRVGWLWRLRVFLGV